MPERRKDNNGRVLNNGESQRKDGLYTYRYTDSMGKRQQVYSATLKALREKEAEIKKQEANRINYKRACGSVSDMLDRYINTYTGKAQTKATYQTHVDRIKRHQIASMPMSKAKSSDVKQFVKELFDEGLVSMTVKGTVTVLRNAFQMAVDDEILVRNPVTVKVQNGIVKQKREALTIQQQNGLLGFLNANRVYGAHQDMIVLLLTTGIRVGEMCGLTIRNVNLENGTLLIDHQMYMEKGTIYHIASPKSDSGNRVIALLPEAKKCLERIVAKGAWRSEAEVDGETGFLFINAKGKPLKPSNVRKTINNMIEQYNKTADCKIEHLSPHILRHTFCTNMERLGMRQKALQYIMGHSSYNVTMDVYAHADSDYAHSEVLRIGTPSTTPTVGQLMNTYERCQK